MTRREMIWNSISDPMEGGMNLGFARPVARLRQGRNDWYRIANKSETEAELLIYDEIGYFGVTASQLVRDLADLDVDTLKVRINSPGGSVFDGIAIHNALKQHKAKVTTQVDGLAASIASVILQAGDTRVAATSGTVMIHNGRGLCAGTAADMWKTADLIDRASDTIAGIYAERGGGYKAKWRARMDAETWYNASEAVKEGLVDEVQDLGEVENSWDLSIFNYQGRDEAPTPTDDNEFTFDPEAFRAAMEEAATCPHL